MSDYWFWNIVKMLVITVVATAVLENYGWYILLAGILIIYLLKKLEPCLEKYRKYRSEREYSALYHKDPDKFSQRVEAQNTFAERLQEQYNKKAEEYKKKIEQREEKKREDIIEKYRQGGHILGSSEKTGDSSIKKSFKPEYNPLMGAGPSSSYRAPKRSCCGGGGCGKK